MAVGYAIVALIAAAVAVFALQNSEPASVRFVVWSRDLPVAALVLLSLAAGAIVAGLPLWLQRWRLRARQHGLEARVAELERALGDRERALGDRGHGPLEHQPPPRAVGGGPVGG